MRFLVSEVTLKGRSESAFDVRFRDQDVGFGVWGSGDMVLITEFIKEDSLFGLTRAIFMTMIGPCGRVAMRPLGFHVAEMRDQGVGQTVQGYPAHMRLQPP